MINISIGYVHTWKLRYTFGLKYREEGLRLGENTKPCLIYYNFVLFMCHIMIFFCFSITVWNIEKKERITVQTLILGMWVQYVMIIMHS